MDADLDKVINVSVGQKPLPRNNWALGIAILDALAIPWNTVGQATLALCIRLRRRHRHLGARFPLLRTHRPGQMVSPRPSRVPAVFLPRRQGPSRLPATQPPGKMVLSQL